MSRFIHHWRPPHGAIQLHVLQNRLMIQREVGVNRGGQPTLLHLHLPRLLQVHLHHPNQVVQAACPQNHPVRVVHKALPNPRQSLLPSLVPLRDLDPLRVLDQRPIRLPIQETDLPVTVAILLTTPSTFQAALAHD